MKAYENIIRDKAYQSQISDQLARLSHSHSSTSFFPSPPKINSTGTTQQHNADTTTNSNNNCGGNTSGVKVKSARKGHNSDSQPERLIDPGLDLASLLTNSIYNTNSSNTHAVDSTAPAVSTTLTSHVTTATTTTTKATILPNITSSSTYSLFQSTGNEPFNDSVIIMTDRTDSRCSTSQLSMQNNINNKHINNNTTTATTNSISSHSNNISMSPLFNSPKPESISGMRGSSIHATTTKLKYNTLLRK